MTYSQIMNSENTNAKTIKHRDEKVAIRFWKNQKAGKQPRYRPNHVTVAVFNILQRLKAFVPSMTMINRPNLV